MTHPSPVTRERILDTAEACFAERGFAGTTVRDIAGAVGLTPAALYNHFEGKEALYEAVLERGIKPLIEVLEGLAASEPGPDAIAATLDGVMGHFARRPNVARLIYHEAVTGGSVLVPLARAWIQPLLATALGEMKREKDSPWSEEDHRRLVTLWVQLVVGHFAVAPLVAELLGEDPLASASIERQTRFLHKLSRLLMAGSDPGDSR